MNSVPIVSASLEEGLDFACNLVVHALEEAARVDSSRAVDMLARLAQYISLRYAGEVRLACEYVESLADFVPDEIEFRRDQFTAQVAWLKSKMGPEE